MKRCFDNQNNWLGQVNGSEQVITVVGTYGDQNPVVRVLSGADAGKALAIKWDTGKILKDIKMV